MYMEMWDEHRAPRGAAQGSWGARREMESGERGEDEDQLWQTETRRGFRRKKPNVVPFL